MEGASVAATAAARAARAEAMEKELSAGNEKAEAWWKAAAASATTAEATKTKEEILQEGSGVSRSAGELSSRAEQLERVVREQSKHLALLLVRMDV